jgi:hypothetical protein
MAMAKFVKENGIVSTMIIRKILIITQVFGYYNISYYDLILEKK